MRTRTLNTLGSVRLPAVLAALIGLVGCGDDDAPPPDPVLAPTYENVEQIVRQSCTFSGSCHGGTSSGRGRLNFQKVFDEGGLITDVLFEEPSCEYAPFPRVKPGVPEESWLWLKIDSPTDSAGNILFTPDPSWDAGVRRLPDGGLAASTCPLVQRGQISSGKLMPMGSRSGISENRRAAIRGWILAGAPGPDGGVTMRDAGPGDLGPGDSGAADAGSGDAGGGDVDAGVPDAGLGDGG
jgi:hypothetical protein